MKEALVIIFLDLIYIFLLSFSDNLSGRICARIISLYLLLDDGLVPDRVDPATSRRRAFRGRGQPLLEDRPLAGPAGPGRTPARGCASERSSGSAKRYSPQA